MIHGMEIAGATKLGFALISSASSVNFFFHFLEGLTTLHLGVRRFKSENGENSGFSGFFDLLNFDLL